MECKKFVFQITNRMAFGCLTNLGGAAVYIATHPRILSSQFRCV